MGIAQQHGPLGAQSAHEALHARVAGDEAVVVDEIAIDRRPIAAARQRLLDRLAVRLARARLRAAARCRWPRRRRSTRRFGRSRRHRRGARVGRRLYGRF
jgi:hypothetical protein